MRALLNLPRAMTLGAITVQHLTLAFPANQPGTGNDATIAMSNSPLVNATNAFSGAASAYSSFPPGPCPPEDVTFYRVPSSNPPVTIKFQNVDRSRGRPPWRAQPGRNETATLEMLQDVIEEYSDPTRIDQKLLHPHYEWDDGGPAPQVFIQMEPWAPDPYQPQDLWLTRRDWASACRGLRDFLEAYPGLGIYFEVYILYTPEAEFPAAQGVLSLDGQETQQRVDVT